MVQDASYLIVSLILVLPSASHMPLQIGNIWLDGNQHFCKGVTMPRVCRVMGRFTEIDGDGRGGTLENLWNFFVAVL